MAEKFSSLSFTVAPFGIDGALEGMAEWQVDDLSPKWIGVCSDLFDANGASFNHSLDGPLSYLCIKCNSGQGAALVTISVHDRPVSLAVFASGRSREADLEALTIFTASVAQASAHFHSAEGRAFSALPMITDRPLLAVVPWPDALIADQEHALARELMLHFAAALLLRV